MIDYGENQSVHCSQQFDENEIKYLRELAKEKNVYFNMYFNRNKKKVPLFANESYMYTKFKIFMEKNNKTIGSIIPSNPVFLSKNSTFSFIFQYNPSQIAYINAPKAPEVSGTFIVLSIGISVIIFFICNILLKVQFMTISTVDISERWRQPKFMKIELYVATFGIGVIISLITYYFLLKTHETHFMRTIIAGIIGFILPSMWRTVFAKLVNEDVQRSDYSIPPLFYNIFFILPLTCANWFGTVICHSLRGLAGTFNIFINMFLSSLIVFVCIFSGKLGKNISKMLQTDECISFEQSKSHHPTCVTEYTMGTLYVAVGLYFSNILINATQQFFLLNEPLNVAHIVQTIVAYGCITFIISCFRTLHLHKSGEFSWMSGFVMRNFILALIVGLREVWRLFFELLQNYHFEASVYYATGVMMVIGVLVGVGAGSSMIAAFSLTFSLFS